MKQTACNANVQTTSSKCLFLVDLMIMNRICLKCHHLGIRSIPTIRQSKALPLIKQGNSTTYTYAVSRTTDHVL